MRRSIIVGVICGILVCGWLVVTATDQEPDKSPMSKEQSQMVEAAQKTYEASNAMWSVGSGEVTLEGVYLWSRRWAEAEADGTSPGARREAYLEHLERMKKLRDIVAAKHQTGAVGGEEDKLQATQYYLTEAEQWLMRLRFTIRDLRPTK